MDPSPLTPYLPIALLLLVAGGIAAIVPFVAALTGPKNPTSVKTDTFEGGNVVIGSARQRFAVKFYVVALLFIVFDIEGVFLYPWAVNFLSLGWFGYLTMAMFASTVVVGLVYVWKKGALEWES